MFAFRQMVDGQLIAYRRTNRDAQSRAEEEAKIKRRTSFYMYADMEQASCK